MGEIRIEKILIGSKTYFSSDFDEVEADTNNAYSVEAITESLLKYWE